MTERNQFWLGGETREHSAFLHSALSNISRLKEGMCRGKSFPQTSYQQYGFLADSLRHWMTTARLRGAGTVRLGMRVWAWVDEGRWRQRSKFSLLRSLPGPEAACH